MTRTTTTTTTGTTPDSDALPPYATRGEVAAYFGMSTRWVLIQSRSGALPATYFGSAVRYAREDVLAFAAARRVGGR